MFEYAIEGLGSTIGRHGLVHVSRISEDVSEPLVVLGEARMQSEPLPGQARTLLRSAELRQVRSQLAPGGRVIRVEFERPLEGLPGTLIVGAGATHSSCKFEVGLPQGRHGRHVRLELWE